MLITVLIIVSNSVVDHTYSANDRGAARAPWRIGSKWLKQIVSKSSSASFRTDAFAASMSLENHREGSVKRS